MALNKTGYGAVDPTKVNLQTERLNWYVSGQVEDETKESQPFVVWFHVTKFEDAKQVKTTWAVKTVTVNDEVVYP